MKKILFYSVFILGLLILFIGFIIVIIFLELNRIIGFIIKIFKKRKKSGLL